MANKDQTIALAGVFQSLYLIQTIAHQGTLDMKFYEISVNSVLNVDADSVLDIYGNNFDNLQLGLKALIDSFSGGNNLKKTGETTKYFINLIMLERKLSADSNLLEQIGHGVNQAKSQLAHFEATDDKIAKILANVYKQTVSSLSPKIMVNGESKYLNNQHHADKIRTLLLSAIRSIILWRQRGGVRWQLFFKRNSIVTLAKEILR